MSPPLARFADGLTALILASQDGKKEVVKFLIDWGADVEAKSNIGWTSLMCAAAYGHLDVVKVLFFQKASVDTQDTEGEQEVAGHSMI